MLAATPVPPLSVKAQRDIWGTGNKVGRCISVRGTEFIVWINIMLN